MSLIVKDLFSTECNIKFSKVGLKKTTQLHKTSKDLKHEGNLFAVSIELNHKIYRRTNPQCHHLIKNSNYWFCFTREKKIAKMSKINERRQ